MKQKFFTFSIVAVIAFLACSWAYNEKAFAQDKDAEWQQALKRLDNQSKVFVAVSKKVTPAVVNISVMSSKSNGRQAPFNDFFQDEFFRRFFRDRMPRRQYKKQAPKPKLRGMGSGVIVDPRGYILSNNHVIRNAEEVIVKLGDKREFKAKIVGADAKTDIAVLKIDGNNLPSAPLGNSDRLEVGQWVLAIGNPFGLSQTVTAGIISAKGRANVGVADYEDFVQTDAAINPGNSGGPLVNLHGKVIGINTAILSRSGGYQGIGFAIPINMARSVMKQIISKGKVVRGWLGVRIQEITPELAKSFGFSQNNGALVADVVKNSPAAKAGLQQGDIILAYNGVPITNINQLRNMVAATFVGEKATLEIFRDGGRITIHAVIGNLAKANWDDGNTNKEVGTHTVEELGIELQTATPELIKKYRYPKNGIVISAIKENSLAERYMLRKDDLIVKINRTIIRSFSDIKRALNSGGRRMLLLVRSGYVSRFVVISRR